ncbi:MAG: 5-carboxymethyl-2-hydroxymuconate isomerase [Lautropia sp.]
MPHLILDHSANLDDADIGGLCAALAAVLRAQRADGKAVYPVGGIRVRAFSAARYCIADGSDRADAYLHATLKLGAGRSEATVAATCEALFDAIKSHLADRFERHGLALSLEVAEFSEAGTMKHNNLHVRLRERAARD